MVVFVKSSHAVTSALASIAAFGTPKNLNAGDTASIQGVARTIASGAMSYYPGTATAFADLAAPYYWWECGALMGAVLDYSHYTGDPTYDRVLATALLAQAGPNYDYMTPSHFGDLGNDDQSFWGFAVLSAAERNFPQPDTTVPSWLDMGQNLWNTMATRWNDNDACGGGLAWQIFPSNPNGITYKNSVSNGGFFQLAARLYRATGNATYQEWANKVWDWSTKVALIDQDFNVQDGVDLKDACQKVNALSFSYSAGIYMYGAAVMANATGGDATWASRAQGVMKAADSFFGPFDNSTGVMYEHACEQVDKCNADMLSFKGYYSRFARASSLMLPSLATQISAQLDLSAKLAAAACSGGAQGTSCGQKWYVGGYDGNTGLGQEMCALETIQGLLVGSSAPPLKGDQIKLVRDFQSGTPSVVATSSSTPDVTPTATPTKRSNVAVAASADMRMFALSGIAGLLAWGTI